MKIKRIHGHSGFHILVHHITLISIAGPEKMITGSLIKKNAKARALSMLKIRVNGTESCHSHKARNRRSGHAISRFCNAVGGARRSPTRRFRVVRALIWCRLASPAAQCFAAGLQQEDQPEAKNYFPAPRPWPIPIPVPAPLPMAEPRSIP